MKFSQIKAHLSAKFLRTSVYSIYVRGFSSESNLNKSDILSATKTSLYNMNLLSERFHSDVHSYNL